MQAGLAASEFGVVRKKAALSGERSRVCVLN